MTAQRVGKRTRTRRADTTSGAERLGGEPDPNGAPERPKPAPKRTLRDRVRGNERLIAALCVLIAGVILIMLGWYGAAHTNIFTEQIPYLISGGLLGLGLIIVAGILASSAAQQKETQALLTKISSIGGTVHGSSQARSDAFIIPGGSAYHVAGCPVIEGKDGMKTMSEREAIEEGYATCRLCGPE